jgi:hypothetical protein
MWKPAMTDPFTDAPLPQYGDIPPKNGIGTAALVLGMIAFVFIFIRIPPLNLLSWFVGLLAVVFGAIGLNRARTGIATNRGAAAAGFFTGLAAVVVPILVILIMTEGQFVTQF